MIALARSVIEAARLLELSSDDLIDPDAAVRILEGIALELDRTDDAERTALREALDELIGEEIAGRDGSPPRQEVVGFYESFMENFSLEERID
jgi:hypothetical protein